MNAIYRFPDQLGGGEYEIPGSIEGFDSVVVAVPGVGDVILPTDALTLVVPPLPPEPDLWGVVLDGRGRAWQRISVATSGWAEAGGSGMCTWTDVCEEGPPTLLTALWEPVTLPWRTTCVAANDDVLEVNDPDSDDHVPVLILGRGTVYLDEEQARAGSRALWVAAEKIAQRR